jgi:phenylacetic acid degradation operon negative regulatory protein
MDTTVRQLARTDALAPGTGLDEPRDTLDTLTPGVAKSADQVKAVRKIVASRRMDRLVGDWGAAQMKPRSLVFDLFGDYLRYRGGEVRLRGLVALMNCFDIPEPTVRVVVGRLRRDGWLESRKVGRETIYALTGMSWQLLDEGRDRIFNRAVGPWTGEWHMVIYSVPEADRALRDQLRKKLAWVGFGPLSSSVWVSPHDRTDSILEAFANEATVQLDVFRSRSVTESADRDLAARAWDLGGLNQDYSHWLDNYRPRLPLYRTNGVTGPAALVERMQLINDYRHFPFRDPDLPTELLPRQWLGRTAFEVFIEGHDLLEKSSEAVVDELLGS